MTTPLHLAPFSPEPHAHRRNQLMAKMIGLGGGIAIVPTASEAVRNRDAYYDFRPDSYFYYLTGLVEPEAVLVLIATPESQKSILFCREKNLEREIWDGHRYGPELAQKVFGVDQALPFSELKQQLSQLLANQRLLFAPMLENPTWDATLREVLASARAAVRTGVSAPHALHDVYALLDEQRLVKDAHELNWLRAAGRISAKGHLRAMQACRAGMHETDLEAEILYSFARDGAQHAAYSSIVAGGANACILHYRAGSALLNDGDLCLIDAGAEYGLYAGDITRTFPINGKFTAAQRAVYEVVLSAQEAAIASVRAGASFSAPHDTATRVLTQGMLDLGLLDKQVVGSVDDAIESGAYRQFYMHRTGHWIGLDVHDCGTYSSGLDAAQKPVWRQLTEGMVLTIEPGLYVRPSDKVPEQFWNIGVRIEDDAIVTAQGCELTTRDVPVAINDIEHLMKH
ncbi:aminopeptidase P N-terminal domain-containing protein [Hydromonas duriensis]|uniref:Xaa-Pro aminopeptidase n=1 Tax=Hydromonas duriensis TaxID=1527608 RepID=A0A4R6Y4J5_9BURK|nr:aminopeptidase P N-terminal domain-containing protein [Hydromonas duriensis]TDR29019.1 aminopeptidase P [Hydromonas duriensis]